MSKYFTVLEIGSGSFKLHHEGLFSTRFQSSLGKGLKNNHLHPDSVKIAMKSLTDQVLPFLKEHEINPSSVLVFATAAIREAMKDPKNSAKNFLQELQSYGFPQAKVFTETDECDYAALAVYEDLKDEYQDFLMLDTGGASHQLVEFSNGKIIKKNSFPIGSHSAVSEIELPRFSKLGYSLRLPLALIGTSGIIVTQVPIINRNVLAEMIKTLDPLDLTGRKEFMQIMVPDTSLHHLFVDFRLEVLPNAFRIIHNCAEELQCHKFLYANQQAMNYVSKYGFNLRSR